VTTGRTLPYLDDTEWSDSAEKLPRPLKNLKAFYGSKPGSSNKMVGSEVRSFIPSRAKKPAMDKEVKWECFCFQCISSMFNSVREYGWN
jgi:cytochrome c oxidase assembly protein Cox11